ncbi:unnamed protein product [Arctogadus glacialis]
MPIAPAVRPGPAQNNAHITRPYDASNLWGLQRPESRRGERLGDNLLKPGLERKGTDSSLLVGTPATQDQRPSPPPTDQQQLVLGLSASHHPVSFNPLRWSTKRVNIKACLAVGMKAWGPEPGPGEPGGARGGGPGCWSRGTREKAHEEAQERSMGQHGRARWAGRGGGPGRRGDLRQSWRLDTHCG